MRTALGRCMADGPSAECERQTRPKQLSGTRCRRGKTMTSASSLLPLWPAALAPRQSSPRLRLGHEVRPQRLAPIGDGGNDPRFQKDFGLLLHVGFEVARKARVDIDSGERSLKGISGHLVAFLGIESEDHV